MEYPKKLSRFITKLTLSALFVLAIEFIREKEPNLDVTEKMSYATLHGKLSDKSYTNFLQEQEGWKKEM